MSEREHSIDLQTDRCIGCGSYRADIEIVGSKICLPKRPLGPLPERIPSHLERLETRHLAAEAEGKVQFVEQEMKALDLAMRAPITDCEKELIAAGDPDMAKLPNWFTYHQPTAEQVEYYRLLREGGMMLARTIVLLCPPSADRSVALRKVREAIMSANASIACGGR